MIYWTEVDYEEQQRRLAHAKKYADLFLETDNLTIQEVINHALAFIKKGNSWFSNAYF